MDNEASSNQVVRILSQPVHKKHSQCHSHPTAHAAHHIITTKREIWYGVFNGGSGDGEAHAMARSSSEDGQLENAKTDFIWSSKKTKTLPRSQA